MREGKQEKGERQGGKGKGETYNEERADSLMLSMGPVTLKRFALCVPLLSTSNLVEINVYTLPQASEL